MEQRELLAEAKRLLETGELFSQSTAQEVHASDAAAEASDSEPEAHVMEPLADDHSNDGEDTPTGVEESAAPAAPVHPSRFSPVPSFALPMRRQSMLSQFWRKSVQAPGE